MSRLRSDLVQAGQRPLAAMVAGEPIMCVRLAEALDAMSVQCYSATSVREAYIDESGAKVSRFSFVRFRAW